MPKEFERRARADRAHLLAQDLEFLARQARAIRLWPFGGGPAARGHALEPEPLSFRFEGPFASAPAAILVVVERRAHIGRTIGGEPRARLGAERFEIGHRTLPPLFTRTVTTTLPMAWRPDSHAIASPARSERETLRYARLDRAFFIEREKLGGVARVGRRVAPRESAPEHADDFAAFEQREDLAGFSECRRGSR